jgi:aerobic carbon-monoxide dehydrogenase medium subunit
VKPAAFEYVAPESVPDAVEALARGGDGAAVLAGGQSLLIEMRYRERRPALLVDINRIPSLSGLEILTDHAAEGVRAGGGAGEGARAGGGAGEGAGAGPVLRIGALARHAELERAAFDDPLAALLREAGRHVAHPPVRNRGTFAGSVAWAHPAAEWNALTMALDGRIVLAGPDSPRTVPAVEWYRGRHRTDLRAGELVTEVRLPLLGAGTAVRFAELRRTHGSFPLVAVVVAVRLDGDRVADARIGLANAADVPLKATAAEDLLRDTEPTAEAVREAAELAAEHTDPVPEHYCSPRYRRHVVSVLVRRCLTGAVEEARP